MGQTKTITLTHGGKQHTICMSNGPGKWLISLRGKTLGTAMRDPKDRRVAKRWIITSKVTGGHYGGMTVAKAVTNLFYSEADEILGDL